MSMMRARVRGHRWVDHPAAAVMKARVPWQWVDCPAAVVMEAREQGRCWIDHPAVAVMEARVQGRHWVDRPSVGLKDICHEPYSASSFVVSAAQHCNVFNSPRRSFASQRADETSVDIGDGWWQWKQIDPLIVFTIES
ncbi:hypothetical protein ACOMHN_017672 [Nucella lapillus]